MMDRQFMRESTRNFKPYYSPTSDGSLRLDTNTNVLGPNPAAVKALSDISDMDINQYPNTYSADLRNVLAEFYGLGPDNFVTGSGSDEILDVLFKTFTDKGDRAVMPYPSYSIYDYFSELNGGVPVLVDLDQDFQLDVDSILAADGKIIMIPSPNNPTGNAFRHSDLVKIIEGTDAPVVIDEAYGEFHHESFIPLVRKYENLIVTRTFSKAYAMAGLRVGYCVCSPEIAEMMTCIRIPYSLNMLSEKAAMAALRDQDFIKRSVDMVERNRPMLAEGLDALGFKCYTSDANFILARSPIDHKVLVKGLKERGIMIRDFGHRRLLEDCVRFTIGTDEMNIKVIEACEELTR